MAAWAAVELGSAVAREVGVTVTPVGSGRFEIYLDGELVYNNKATGVKGISTEDINALKATIRERLGALASAPR